MGSKTHYNILATDRLQLAPTYADLQNVSDIVVKATVIPGKENKLITADDGTVVFGYTITQLNVTEVFKGNINEDYPINITEEYYTLSGNGNEVYTQGNYMPAQESGEYIFFLKHTTAPAPMPECIFLLIWSMVSILLIWLKPLLHQQMLQQQNMRSLPLMKNMLSLPQE